MPLTINPDIKVLIHALTAEELGLLEANLLRDGCLDPLIIWQEEQILLDGHHRLAICERHGFPYATSDISLPDWDSAKLWVLRHQRGRRNSTPNQLSYNRGKEYEIQKRQGRRTDLTSGNSYQKLPSTATALAHEHQVSEKTIRNDFAYAQALDTLADTMGNEVRDKARDHESKLTQQDVKTLAKLSQHPPYGFRETVDSALAAKTPKQVRQIVRDKAREVREQQAYIDAIARSNSPKEDWLPSLRPKPTPTPADGLAPRFRQTLHSLEVLHTCLQMVSLPEVLESHREACLALGKAYRQIEQLMGLQPEPPAAAAPEASVPELAPAEAPPRLRDQVGLQHAVWLTVQQLEPCTNAQVKEALDEKRQVVYTALQALVTKGKIVKEGETYRVVEPGSAA
jgi:hypothetical protein